MCFEPRKINGGNIYELRFEMPVYRRMVAFADGKKRPSLSAALIAVQADAAVSQRSFQALLQRNVIHAEGGREAVIGRRTELYADGLAAICRHIQCLLRIDTGRAAVQVAVRR